MRINPETGYVVSHDDNYCPNCDSEIDYNYAYCDNCGEYVGIVYNGVVEQVIIDDEYNEKIEDMEKRLEEIKKELEKLENS